MMMEHTPRCRRDEQQGHKRQPYKQVTDSSSIGHSLRGSRLAP